MNTGLGRGAGGSRGRGFTRGSSLFDLEPESSQSRPIADVGITPADFAHMFNLDALLPGIQAETMRRVTDEQRSAHEAESKRARSSEYQVGAVFQRGDEQQQAEYVRKVNEEERRKASEYLYQLRVRANEVKMETDQDDRSTVAGDLDGVSTCLDEVNALLDPSFRQNVDHFFKARRRIDYEECPLPIESKRKSIVTQVRLNRVVIIKGTTGCGKTTQVPQYIMEDCYSRDQHFNIVVTQPRRIAATSVAERVCHERGWNIGELVGYQIGMDKKAGELTRLLYCTTGVLLQKLISEKKMDNYTHIIIDEVHERNAETDLLLMVVRKFLWTQAAPVKVILMSATIDSAKFSDYFTLKAQNGVPIRPGEIKIEEPTKPVMKVYIDTFGQHWAREIRNSDKDNAWLDFDVNDPHINATRFQMSAHIIKHFDTLDKKGRKGAVLVFLPGYDDINQMKKYLEHFMSTNKCNWLILPLHSSVTLEEQIKVFNKTTVGERKIILSTNIAESSITVPDVVYVIDYCLTKNLCCDQVTNYPTLKLEWASHANCDQRAGRCGRVQEGRVFRMVTCEFYDRHMKKEGLPELLRTPLENSILKVKKLDLGPPKQLLALCIDSPNLSDLRRSIVRLKRVGALTTKMDDGYNEEDGDLTFLGKMMADLPLDVQLSKFIMLGYLFDCLDDCIVIAACLSLQNFFDKRFGDPLQAYKARLAWSERTFSDPISYWYAFQTFRAMVTAGIFDKSSEKARAWCKRNFIQYSRLRDVLFLVDELKRRLEHSGISVPMTPNERRSKFEDQLILKVVIAGAFYPYYYLKNPIADPKMVNKELNEKDPRYTVKLSGLPQNQGVLYANQIRKAMSEISTNMDLEFEETHCFVIFPSNENPLAQAEENRGKEVADHKNRQEETLYQGQPIKRKIFEENQVETAVYLAIKMRRCNIPVQILKYKPSVAEDRLQTCQRIRDDKIVKAQYFRTNRFRVPAYTSCKIPEPRLPPRHRKRIDIFITEIGPDGRFWVQYRDERTQKMVEELEIAFLQAFRPEIYPYTNPKVGDILITKCDEVPCRAKVTRIDRRRRVLEIFFLDFGGTGEIPFYNLSYCVKIDPMRMPPNLISTPALALESRFCEVMPSPARSMNQIEDLAKLREYVNDKRDMWAMVYSVVNGIVALKVFRAEDDGVSLNDKLLSEGMFVRMEESALSLADCQLRLNTPSINDEDDPIYSYEEVFDVEPPYTENEDRFLNENVLNNFNSPFSKERIKLRGPYTPIEISFGGLTRQDSMLQVTIEQDSVNSVCLDPDPFNSNRQLIVAGNIGLQQTSGRLTARSTTLMPDIRGFPSLMALLFAPAVEFRCNKDQTRYTGVVCGLGYDVENQKSYDPDNDLEMVFDCYIDNKDIGKCNVIRYHISDVLSSEKNFHELSGHAILDKQRKMRENVIELLCKFRLSAVPLSKGRNAFAWGLNVASISGDNSRANFTPTYPPHKPVAEVDFDVFKEKVAENLEYIKLVLETNMRATVTCELCEEKFFTNSQLLSHVLKQPHVPRVKELFKKEIWQNFQIQKEFSSENFNL